MKKILVTGAGGFIGSHLVTSLVESGYEVRAFVRYNSRGSSGFIDEIPHDLRSKIDVMFGDIRDYESVIRAVSGVDVVANLAALIGIPYSYEAPRSYVDVNVCGALNVLQACRSVGVERVIQISTSEVYGKIQYSPIDEHHPLGGISPYAASKIGADQLALSYYASFDLPVVVVRPFNTFGPRQSQRAIIPTIIAQALEHHSVTLGSLTPTRDFTYVKDTCRGVRAAIEASDIVNGEVIQLGTGFEISIGSLVDVVSRVMGKSLSITAHEERFRPEKSEVDRLVSDFTKAKTMLGWTPDFMGFEGLSKGIEHTLEWLMEQRRLGLETDLGYRI